MVYSLVYGPPRVVGLCVMPLSKQYLRYEHAATLGVVNGRKSNLLLTEAAAGGKRRALVVAPAVEDVIIWDPRRSDKVSLLASCFVSLLLRCVVTSLHYRRPSCVALKNKKCVVCV